MRICNPIWYSGIKSLSNIEYIWRSSLVSTSLGSNVAYDSYQDKIYFTVYYNSNNNLYKVNSDGSNFTTYIGSGVTYSALCGVGKNGDVYVGGDSSGGKNFIMYNSGITEKWSKTNTQIGRGIIGLNINYNRNEIFTSSYKDSGGGTDYPQYISVFDYDTGTQKLQFAYGSGIYDSKVFDIESNDTNFYVLGHTNESGNSVGFLKRHNHLSSTPNITINYSINEYPYLICKDTIGFLYVFITYAVSGTYYIKVYKYDSDLNQINMIQINNYYLPVYNMVGQIDKDNYLYCIIRNASESKIIKIDNNLNITMEYNLSSDPNFIEDFGRTMSLGVGSNPDIYVGTQSSLSTNRVYKYKQI